MAKLSPEEAAISRRKAVRALFADGYIDTDEPTDDQLCSAAVRIFWEHVGADGVYTLTRVISERFNSPNEP